MSAPATHPSPLLLTGASSGIGLAAALALAADHELILPVRNAPRGEELQERIRRLLPDARIHTPICDLASLGSVRALATDCPAFLGGRLLGGIGCIAGVQIVSGLQRSVDGYELTFAVHHLAHTLLISMLQSQLAPGAAVLFVGSTTHNAGDFWARLFGFKGGRFSSVESLARGDTVNQGGEVARGNERYATAKLCNLMTMYTLARQIPAEQVRFFAVDPGLVPGTGLARDNNAFNRLGWSILRHGLPALPGVSTPSRSGNTIAWALTAEALRGRSGIHFDYRRRETSTSAESMNAELGTTLLRDTRQLLGI